MLRRLLETNFDMLCSSLDVLYDNMGLGCIRIYQDFIWTSSSGNENMELWLCAEIVCLSACVIVCFGVIVRWDSYAFPPNCLL